ncbi:hypothetical protein DEO72_LG7g1948 [Vigna unguiculata]|uniref:Uncharacterized protein n=1 Tax=Vigna unguiculata TaxID=3917 RepID=A0A4D6MI11_VIGUN|nr:hypothetical protein DEO72_LG7g1948 [Vigna unguiculata]
MFDLGFSSSGNLNGSVYGSDNFFLFAKVLTRKVNNARKGYYGYPSSSSGHVRASFVQTSPLVWNSISTAQPRASGAPIVIGVARSALLDPIYARSILLVASLLDLLHSSLLPLLDLLYSSLHRYYFFERQC